MNTTAEYTVSRTGEIRYDDPNKQLARILCADVWHEKHGYGRISRTSGDKACVWFYRRPDGSKLRAEDMELGWLPQSELIDVGEHT
jgi:hypothetical protein